MIITVELTPTQTAEVRQYAEAQNTEAVRHLLADALTPRTIQRVLDEQPKPLTLEEFNRLSDEIAAITLKANGGKSPMLSDYAVSREGIYEDHP